MLRIKEAAPLLLGEEATGRTLQKRLKNSVETKAGRSRWKARGVDPDSVRRGVNDPWTEDMAAVLGLEHESITFGEQAQAEESAPVLREEIKPPVPAPPPPPVRAAKPKASKKKKADKSEGATVPNWLVGVLVGCAPIAEGYSFARIGTINYGLETFGQLAWAFIGYVAGMIVFVNYVRIEDQTRAEVWAGVLAVLQLLTHLSASGWNWTTATASVLIVACSWAINAAYRRK